MAQFLTNEKYGAGTDGSLSQNTATDATANTSASGTSGTTTLTVGSATGFANGNIVLIHQSRNGGSGAGAWELNVISSGGATTTWTMKYALANTYATTGQVYLLKQYTTVTINTGQTFTGANWDGLAKGGILALLANGSITVTGNIFVKGQTSSGSGGANGGGYLGGSVPGSGIGQTGEGTSGAIVQQNAANGNGGGGANSATDGGGGGGGNGGAGSNGTGAGAGLAGNTSGAANLVTMVFGGGGGAPVDSSNAGGGGSGGGIVLLIAPTITVTGSISGNGGNGKGGSAGTAAGGGAGAGGSIILKGQTITLGSSLVTATGGTGGAGSGGAGNGGNGGAGRIHADYSGTISGTTNPALDSTQDSTLANGIFGSMT